MVYVGGKLKKSYYCLKPLVGNYKPGAAVSTAVFTYIFACALLCSNHFTSSITIMENWFTVAYLGSAVVIMMICKYDFSFFHLH